MSDRIKELIDKSHCYDLLLLKAKGYGYDSLCLRYIMARDKQMEYEIALDKKSGSMKEDKIRARADRDKMRFFEILDELLGEHD